MPERPRADGDPVDPATWRVLAILVSWRQVDQLAPCLDALEAQDHPHLQVVVVDNDSGDGSVELARAWAAGHRRHPVDVIANDTNRGFTGGVHDGLAAGDADAYDAVWLCNVDAVPRRDHLSRLVAALAADPGRAAVQGRLLRTHRGHDGEVVVDSTGIEATSARLFRDRDEGRPATQVQRAPGEVFGVTGACALLRREALADVAWDGAGPWTGRVLTEELFAYFDDVDLAWRLRRMGWRAWHVPDAVAWHERGGAGPRRSPLVEELNAANRLLVLRTCDDRASRPRLLVTLTTVLKAADLLVSHPRALLAAARRTRAGWGAAGRRREELQRRARIDAGTVVANWFVAFDFGPWVAAWWRRVRGRAPGVATTLRRR